MPVRSQRVAIGTTVQAPVRAFNVTYQNLTGRPLIVILTTTNGRANNGDASYTNCLVDTVSPPLVLHSQSGIFACVLGAGALTLYFSQSFVVPNGYFYRVESVLAGGGAIALVSWLELSLVEPITEGF